MKGFQRGRLVNVEATSGGGNPDSGKVAYTSIFNVATGRGICILTVDCKGLRRSGRNVKVNGISLIEQGFFL